MSDRRKEAEEKMAKAIFISGDCWLCVFNLLSPRQLGFGISMISHRFDFYVDEHFKTRKWALQSMKIFPKFEADGTKEMEIADFNLKPLPIPQMQLPRKVIGFKRIIIQFIARNTIAFLHRFRQLFAVCPINLFIDTTNDRILELILRNIWPMLGKSIHGLELSTTSFHRLRHFVPSILNECPSLRFVIFYYGYLFTEFPADDSAAASNGQALAKWLFTPRPDDVPKVFKCALDMNDGILASKIAALKAAFASACSPVNFIISVWFQRLFFASSVVPFALTNELTREQLALKRTFNSQHFLFVRCPIARDESKWTKWEKEAIGWRMYDQWNRIDISVYRADDIVDGLLDTTPGPSDQQK